jgi:hypothetical protein
MIDGVAIDPQPTFEAPPAVHIICRSFSRPEKPAHLTFVTHHA